MAKLRDVNTTDLAGAIRLGCATMQRVFNADDHDRPHFMATAAPPELAGFGFGATYTEAHVPGRHLNALLTAEDVLGIAPDARAITNHRNAFLFAFSGTVPLPLNRHVVEGPLVNFADHNIRENMFACYALVRYRKDEQAREIAERCIATILERWSPKAGWDIPWLESHGVKLTQQTFVWGLARSIGPLVKYHQASGSPRALELAEILAEKATEEFFRAEGEFDAKLFGHHTHSTTCALSSLAQLAALRGDARLMQCVRSFYDRGLWRIRDELGWVMEQAGNPAWNADRGEINNTGDIAEAALLLARAGDATKPGEAAPRVETSRRVEASRYADVERMLRCHLLPAQLRDTSFIVEPASREGVARDRLEDGKRDVAARMRGGFGFPAPYGHQPLGMAMIEFCLDIVGGGVGSLCEAWREAVVDDARGLCVNLLFDRQQDGVTIESPYTHDRLRVTLGRPRPLWVRIPTGEMAKPGDAPIACPPSLRVVGAEGGWSWRDGYAHIPAPPAGRPVEFHFDLPTRDLTLRHHIHPTRVRLRGESVLAMDNHGADLTFFEPMP
ncbi:MAG: hypothetical protein NTW19_03575 [Planctomycetota bacterium]|nr:hypothetical protein [Planctomycetota bacterium]